MQCVCYPFTCCPTLTPKARRYLSTLLLHVGTQVRSRFWLKLREFFLRQQEYTLGCPTGWAAPPGLGSSPISQSRLGAPPRLFWYQKAMQRLGLLFVKRICVIVEVSY